MEELPLRLKILQVGEPVLRQQARPLSPAEIRSAAIRQLIDLMRDTMHDAPGVGLAAPQIGLPLQLAVIEDREDYLKDIPPAELAQRKRRPVRFHVIINPRITLSGGAPADFFEGCLSLPGFMALVSRAAKVRVECLDEHARQKVIEAEGWYARILQHEIDHLHGTIYIDRMQPRSFMTNAHFSRYWKDKPIEELRSDLRLSLSAGA